MDEPPVVVFMQEGSRRSSTGSRPQGEWRAETAWPVAGRERAVLYLRDDGRLGAADRTPTGADELTTTRRSGVTGGLWSGGLQFGLPGDQRPDEALSLVYTSRRSTRTCRARPAARAAARRLHGDRDRLLREPQRRAARRRLAPRREGHAQRHAARLADRPVRADAGRARGARGRARHDRLVFAAGHRIRVADGQRGLAERLADPAARDAASTAARRAVARRAPARAGRGRATAPVFRPSPVVVQRHASAIRPARPLDRHPRRADRPRRVRDPVPDRRT